jgi:hypothetical protein
LTPIEVSPVTILTWFDDNTPNISHLEHLILELEITIKDYPIPLITYQTVSLPGATTTGFLYHDDSNKWLLTARHNLYPVPKMPPPVGYGEALIEQLVLKFKGDGTYSREWELSQNDLLDYGRISADRKIDIAAINLTELLKKTPVYEEYLLSKSFFTARNLSEKHSDYDTGNRVKVLGFRAEYNFQDINYTVEYPRKILPITETKFVFAVDAFCPSGVSGSPVILDESYNTNYSVILLGICAGNNHENRGMITYANSITDIILNGIKLHKKNGSDLNSLNNSGDVS